MKVMKMSIPASLISGMRLEATGTRFLTKQGSVSIECKSMDFVHSRPTIYHCTICYKIQLKLHIFKFVNDKIAACLQELKPSVVEGMVEPDTTGATVAPLWPAVNPVQACIAPLSTTSPEPAGEDNWATFD